MSEVVDIYDGNFKYIGTAEKKAVHLNGLWHKSFICMVFNPDTKKVFFQKKVPGRYSFNRPDYFDFTVGGHYIAGERIEDGVREIKEELGLTIKFKSMISLGIRKKAVRVAKNFIEKEFQFIFLLPLDFAIEKFSVDNDEVSGLAEIELDALLELFSGKREDVDAKIIEKNIVFKQTVNLASFVPSYIKDNLYQRLLSEIRNYIEGKELTKWDFNE